MRACLPLGRRSHEATLLRLNVQEINQVLIIFSSQFIPRAPSYVLLSKKCRLIESESFVLRTSEILGIRDIRRMRVAVFNKKIRRSTFSIFHHGTDLRQRTNNILLKNTGFRGANGTQNFFKKIKLPNHKNPMACMSQK